MSLRIRKGDKVVVIAGKNKGKSGKALRVSGGGSRVVIEGLNLVKKHIRRRSESEPGGVKEIPLPIHISNVALFCPNCNKGVRVSVERAKDKSKTRICKKCQRAI